MDVAADAKWQVGSRFIKLDDLILVGLQNVAPYTDRFELCRRPPLRLLIIIAICFVPFSNTQLPPVSVPFTHL